MKDHPTACLILIGNEILSGRTQDQNLNYLAKALLSVGIRMNECRIIPDNEDIIGKAINECRHSFDYVFTTGGIGPTHDDITSTSVAKAFGVELERNHEAVKMMEEHKGTSLNQASLKMADLPIGSKLIHNPVTAAPGFIMENVYVMAGIPAVMQGMIESLLPTLKRGKPIFSETILSDLSEGKIAKELELIQKRYPSLEIGSYPHWISETEHTLHLVVRGHSHSLVNQALAAIKETISQLKNDIYH